MLDVVLFSRGGGGNQIYGIAIIINSSYITTILGTGVCYSQVINNKYVTNIILYYYYIYYVILYISYEDPVLLTKPATDFYHISHHEVCTVITT